MGAEKKTNIYMSVYHFFPSRHPLVSTAILSVILACKWVSDLVCSVRCSLQTFTQWLSDTNDNVVWLVWGLS
jgi:hypothetical protein